jgi:hypothetical protein
MIIGEGDVAGHFREGALKRSVSEVRDFQLHFLNQKI